MNRDFGQKKTKGCFSSKARFLAISDFPALVTKIATAHRANGVCPARLAAFFSEEHGCAALKEGRRVVAREIYICKVASCGVLKIKNGPTEKGRGAGGGRQAAGGGKLRP